MGIRETAPFGVRMPDELKEALQREAKINGRSLNQEIVARLRSSLEQPVRVPTNGYTVHQGGQQGYSEGMSDAERQMVAVFRRMPPEKQLALLSLFK